MRILILTNFDVGLYQFRKELIGELLKSHEVYIALPDGDRVRPLEEMGCRFRNISMERRGMNPLKDWSLVCHYERLLRQIKPDMVITYTIKPNIYGGFLARLRHIPYAVNITGLGTAFQGSGILRRLVTVMYKVACRKANVVFFENEENCRIFIREGIVRESQTCTLWGAGVNLEHYQVTEYPGGDGIRFLFVGRVMKEKGIDELFAAMKRLVADGCRCSLDVVGLYEENYHDTIQRCEAEGWLRYHGYQKDVRPFIANCHCFVLPSWHEGMANTNLECAASGRPVITSRIHGCMEAVEDGVTGFLCGQKNSEDLYRVMKRFCRLPEDQRSAMGLAGRQRMEMMFDRKTVVASTVKALFRDWPNCGRK